MNTTLFSALIFIVASLSAQAQEITVRKTIGQKAIVRFSGGIVPEVNQVYMLASDREDLISEAMVAKANSRDYFIGLSNSMPLTLGASSSLALDASVQFGWNFGDFELAPTLALAKTKVTTGSSFGFHASALADINFVENVAGETFVPAFILSLGFGSEGTLTFGAGVAAKLFVLGQSQSAIRLAARFDGEAGGGSFNKSLRILDVGIQTYF